MVKREVGKVNAQIRRCPRNGIISKESSVRHCVIEHGKVMIQVNATYKPGDRPESIIRFSGGLFCGVIVRLRVFHLLLSSVVIIQSLCAGGAQDIHAKIYSWLIIACGY